MTKIYTSILFILLSISLGYSQNNPPIIEQEPSLVVLQNIPQNLDLDELNINVTDLDDDNVIVSSSVSQYDCVNISVLTLAQGYGNGASNTLGAGNVQTFKSISTGFITKLAVEFRGSSTSTTQAEIEVYRNNNFDPNSATDVELIGTLTLNIPTGFNVMGEGIFDKPIYLEENRMYAFRKVSGPGILMRQGSFYYPGRTFNHDFDNTLIINESGGTNNDWKFSITQYALSGLSPLTVPVTADDGTDQTTANVEVYHLSEVLPTIITQDISVNLDENGSINITPQQIDSGSTTACGGNLTLTLDVDNFDCTTIGLNTVTLTGEDEFGNSASATAIVTVVDDLAPTVVNQDITVELDETGSVSISVEDIDNGSSDNCSLTNLSLDITEFTCDNLGENTVTLTGEDEFGNSASATAIVTVVDNLAPTAIAKDITVVLDANGNVSVSASQIDNGSSDNCGVSNISTNLIDVISCVGLGLNEVTLTGEDEFGNSASATAIVTVVDNLAPTAIAKDITVVLDANGSANIQASDIDNSSSDNCSIDNLTLDIDTFDCSSLGENLVTFTATDASGNQSSATAVVTVEDNLAPTVVTQDITVELDETGSVSISVEDIDNGSSDNCSLTNLSLDITEFTCDNLGENTVTLTGEDEFGNSASATAVVTVEDNLAPSLTTQDITLDLAGNASISILPNDVLDQVTDNCTNSENITLSLDVDTFTSTGTYTVSLTGVDEEGNSISMSAQVVVDDTLGTNDVNFNSGLSLYPNPAIDRITIEHQNSPIDQVDVFDINGRLVKASREAQLDVSSLSSGVYIVKVRSNQKHAFIRFIKQ